MHRFRRRFCYAGGRSPKGESARDAAVSEKESGIKMTFFNPSENKWKEVIDTEYRPYFYIPYPTPEEDLKVTQEQKLKINLVEKTDLFTRQSVKLTKVELCLTFIINQGREYEEK